MGIILQTRKILMQPNMPGNSCATKWCPKDQCFPRAHVRHPAPDFQGKVYFQHDFKDVKLSDYKGKYLVLFFYPADFTFVCPTEILAYADCVPEFEKLGCNVIGCSTDT